MTPIPAALRKLLEDRERDLLDHPDPDEVVAEAVAEIIQVLLDEAVLDIDELLDTAMMDALGGAGYVRAVLAWRDADRGCDRALASAATTHPQPASLLPPARPKMLGFYI